MRACMYGFPEYVYLFRPCWNKHSNVRTSYHSPHKYYYYDFPPSETQAAHLNKYTHPVQHVYNAYINDDKALKDAERIKSIVSFECQQIRYETIRKWKLNWENEIGHANGLVIRNIIIYHGTGRTKTKQSQQERVTVGVADHTAHAAH